MKSISGRNCRDILEFDHPFKDYTAPVPTWDELETMGGMALEKIPKVILVGEMGNVVLNR